MLKKMVWLIAIGLLIHILEYGFGPSEGVARAVAYLLGVPLLILYALSSAPLRIGGRLKGAKSPDSSKVEAKRLRDPIFEIGAILYAGLYLGILFRFRPRTWDRFLDLFLTLSLVEAFWLIAPILTLWWYRRRPLDRNESGA